MKVRVIIQARMGSRRLRGKSLTPIAGKSLLQRVIDGAKKLEFINEVVVATTNLQEDDVLEACAATFGVGCFRGDVVNVLHRFVNASADMDEKDNIVRVTADNPLHWIEISKAIFENHIKSNADYTHIDGLSHVACEVIRVGALRDVWNSRKTSLFDQEHVTPFFRKNNTHYIVNKLPNDFEGLRPDLDKYLTVDDIGELERFEKIFEQLGDCPIKTEVNKWLDERIKGGTDCKEKHIKVDLAGIPTGRDFPTFVIAEIGQNHNGSVDIAKKLIDMAVSCGADAVKFQKRDIPSELTREAFDKPYDNPNSFGRTYGEHRINLELDESQHLELKEYAQAKGIIYFCTPCDVLSVQMLERIGCPFYKVASRDLTNLPLLEAIGKTGKSVIISTGMASYKDIDEAIKALSVPVERLIIMQCTSEYPCKLENVNLKVIESLEKKYKCVVGLSDHTSGVIVSSVATVMGASIIEKHITLDRTMKGTDQPGSLEYSGLKKLIDYIRAIEKAVGDGVKEIHPSVQKAKVKLARSLTSKVSIPIGTILKENMITLKSPGDGIAWSERELVLGKKSTIAIQKDVTLKISDFE